MSLGVDWDPSRTSVFAVGITEWTAECFPSFSREDRRDGALVDAFAARGVPRERIVHLQDGDATKAALERAFVRHLAAAAPGELLVFYFSGHGTHDERGASYLVPRDGAHEKPTQWSAADIFATIDRSFRGGAVVMLLDACYSGGFARALREESPLRVPNACLAAALATQSTTAATYFTDTLIDALAGRAWVDHDGDGSIQLGELAEQIASDLAFSVGQLCTAFASNEVMAGLRLARGVPRRAPEVGLNVEAQDQFGDWAKARVIDARSDDGGRFLVHFTGLDAKWDEWVERARIRPHAPRLLAPGTAVVAKNEDDEWVAGTVIE
jgi:hypothetical protein